MYTYRWEFKFLTLEISNCTQQIRKLPSVNFWNIYIYISITTKQGQQGRFLCNSQEFRSKQSRTDENSSVLISLYILNWKKKVTIQKEVTILKKILGSSQLVLNLKRSFNDWSDYYMHVFSFFQIRNYKLYAK